MRSLSQRERVGVRVDVNWSFLTRRKVFLAYVPRAYLFDANKVSEPCRRLLRC